MWLFFCYQNNRGKKRPVTAWRPLCRLRGCRFFSRSVYIVAVFFYLIIKGWRVRNEEERQSSILISSWFVYLNRWKLTWQKCWSIINHHQVHINTIIFVWDFFWVHYCSSLVISLWVKSMNVANIVSREEARPSNDSNNSFSSIVEWNITCWGYRLYGCSSFGMGLSKFKCI